MDEQQAKRAYHTANLIIRHLKGELMEDDIKELHTWINENDENYSLFEDLTDHNHLISGLLALGIYKPGGAWLRFNQRINRS